jgi:2-polyprenyl-6-methoxyphenol hydroxylase-like FAD-dependent oxidoreductase
MPPGLRLDHAVVIGGSVAGLLAARVLSEYCERVTLLDRDELDDTLDPRKGVPQAPQTHVVLTKSYEALQELFPGLVDELVAEGASVYDSGVHMAAKLNGCWVKPGKCDLFYVDCTRRFYEASIRKRVSALPNVTILARTAVRAVTADATGAVTGVECQDVGRGSRSKLAAELIVDAAGRASHAPRWLEALGYGLPVTEEVKIDLGYVGALYQPPPAPAFAPRAKLHVIYPDPPSSWRGGLLHPVEGGVWQLSQWGLFGDHPPLDDAGFAAYSQTLASPEISSFLRHARRVSEFRRMGVPVNRWQRYDRMRRFPRSFFSIGDAVSSVNPIYGQGMTKAAIHAMHLRKLLRSSQSAAAVAERMRRDLPALVEKQAWMTTVYGDLVYPQAVGRRPADFRFVTWYTRCIAELGSTHLDVRKSYQRALTLHGGMYSLFRPSVFAKAMAYAARRPFVPLEQRVNTGPMPVAD